MFWPLIILGGPIFWVLFVVWIVILVGILDAVNDVARPGRYGTSATVATIAFVAILCFFGNGLSLIPWLLHWWLPIVAAYVPAGLITAVFRWLFFCYDDRCKLEERICEYKHRNQLLNPNSPTVLAADRDGLLAWLNSNRCSARLVNIR